MQRRRDDVLIGILNLPMAHFDSSKSTKTNVRVRIHCKYSVLEVKQSAVVHTALAMHSLSLMADRCVTNRHRKYHEWLLLHLHLQFHPYMCTRY